MVEVFTVHTMTTTRQRTNVGLSLDDRQKLKDLMVHLNISDRSTMIRYAINFTHRELIKD